MCLALQQLVYFQSLTSWRKMAVSFLTPVPRLKGDRGDGEVLSGEMRPSRNPAGPAPDSRPTTRHGRHAGSWVGPGLQREEAGAEQGAPAA